MIRGWGSGGTADAHALGACAFGREGSNPSSPTSLLAVAGAPIPDAYRPAWDGLRTVTKAEVAAAGWARAELVEAVTRIPDVDAQLAEVAKVYQELGGDETAWRLLMRDPRPAGVTTSKRVGRLPSGRPIGMQVTPNVV